LASADEERGCHRARGCVESLESARTSSPVSHFRGRRNRHRLIRPPSGVWADIEAEARASSPTMSPLSPSVRLRYGWTTLLRDADLESRAYRIAQQAQVSESRVPGRATCKPEGVQAEHDDYG